MMPMYLPLVDDETGREREEAVRFGAVSVYMRQIGRAFRRMPLWLAKLMDSRLLLSLIAKYSGTTRSRGLEELTLSMLRGDEGFQSAEFDQFVDWLKLEKPDVLYFSNALLLGGVSVIRRELNCRIVCSLQDEDTWIEGMSEKYVEDAWDLMAKRAREVDLLIAPTDFYAKKMSGKMNLDGDRIVVSAPGLPESFFKDGAEPSEHPPAIGYMSKMQESFGLDLLLEAFVRLKKDEHHRDLHLKISGGSTGEDKSFLAGIRRSIREAGLESFVEFVEAKSAPARKKFYSGLTLLSVPIPAGEAFGHYVIEANALGVPVVQPRVAAYPEVLEKTGGGITYEPPESVDALFSSLDGLLKDSGRMRELAKAGRANTLAYFTADASAGRFIEALGKVTD